MPRKAIIKQSEFPYHVYNRSIDKRFFDVPMKWLWKTFCDEAYAAATLWNGRIHAAILMGNHFHILISTPDANLGDFIKDFQSEVARKISLYLGTDGYRFGSRYKSSIVSTESYFLNVFKYLYQNPVRAGLVTRVEGYPFSTLRGLLGESKITVPVWSHAVCPELFEKSADQLLDWLNEPFLKSEVKAIKAGLRKKTFAPALSYLTTKSKRKFES